MEIGEEGGAGVMMSLSDHYFFVNRECLLCHFGVRVRNQILVFSDMFVILSRT